MNLAQLLSTYLSANLLIAVGVSGLGLFSILGKHIRLKVCTELRLHYRVLFIIIGLSCIHPLIPKSEILSPTAKIWSAQSMSNFDREYTVSKGGYLSVPTPGAVSTLSAQKVATISILIILLLSVLGGLSMVLNFRALFKIKRNSYLIRKNGWVQIFVSDLIQVPFSYWLPGQANIVLPSSLIERRQDYRMVVCHELQHHRQRDTLWVYVMWGLKLTCIINPFIYFWNRWISEIQEFACDETLVDRNKVESQAYARCLIQVAESAINHQYLPFCATGLLLLIERNLLKRRIKRMISKSSTKAGWSIGVSASILFVTILGTTAYASKGLVQDRRVTLAQANEMAIRAKSECGFPMVVNDLVITQLNRYIGTPEGREFMKNSLARMENHRAVVSEYLEKYGVPSEILAIPIVESGYQNLTEAQSGTPGKAAGIWQFIPSTARNFGLQVDSQKDERLDVKVNTDAAMRLLQANKLRFKDWHLSVLAYNMGEEALQNGINSTASRNAWTLIHKGYEGDKDYLPRLIAAILIMKNPESVE